MKGEVGSLSSVHGHCVRDTRIELVLTAWEAVVLPLNESRTKGPCTGVLPLNYIRVGMILPSPSIPYQNRHQGFVCCVVEDACAAADLSSTMTISPSPGFPTSYVSRRTPS